MSEAALLKAVRDRIRVNAKFTDVQVNVELEEMAPAVVGDLYVMVVSAGTEAGPSHATNQGARDILYNVDVELALRAPRVPRDRRRNMLLDLSNSFEFYQAAVMDQVDFKYEVNDAANAYIAAESGSDDGFIEVLKFVQSGPFRPASSSLFAGTSGEAVAAVVRTVHFRGARRLEVRRIT